jgi:LysR family hydrogen peroxide-inducible transcriptional activator
MPWPPSPLRALTLRQLQFFSVLVEEGHFGRAARRLAITQPALSNAIKQMEKLLGTELLTRSTHRLELTPVGAEVLARTDFLVNAFDVALRDIESTVQRGRAFVRVGVIPSASARVAAVVSEFLQQDGQREDRTRLARRALDRACCPNCAAVSSTWRWRPSRNRPAAWPASICSAIRWCWWCGATMHWPRPADASWEAIGKERLVLFESGSMPALGNPARESSRARAGRSAAFHLLPLNTP